MLAQILPASLIRALDRNVAFVRQPFLSIKPDAFSCSAQMRQITAPERLICFPETMVLDRSDKFQKYLLVSSERTIKDAFNYLEEVL